MASLNDYIASLTKNKPNYGSLFSTPATTFSSLQPKPLNLPSLSPAKPAVQPTPTVASAPAATATKPTAITPVTSPAPTAAKSQYVNTLTSSTPTSPVAPAPASNPVQQSAPATGADSANSKSYLDSYRDYLAQYTSSLKPSDEVTAANTKLAEITSKIDERSLKARREYEASLDKEGGLLAGNQAAARQGERRNNSELADLAVQEKGAAALVDALTGSKKASTDSLKALLDVTKPLQVGDTYIDPTTGKIISDKSKDAFSLSEGQTRYEYDPKTGSYKAIANAPKTTAAGGGTGIIGTNGQTYTPGVNPTVDSWANRIQNGTAKITDIPASQAALRNSVTVALDAMGNSASGKPTTTELGKAALGTAQSLLTKFDEGKGTSAVGKSGLLNSLGYGLLPGTDRANFVTDFNSLKSQLSLEGVKYLKGQGAVSDSERALLGQAVTKLSLNQSEEEFKKTLTGIINTLKGGNQVLVSPDGTQEVDVAELTPAELKEAQDAGWVSK